MYPRDTLIMSISACTIYLFHELGIFTFQALQEHKRAKATFTLYMKVLLYMFT